MQKALFLLATIIFLQFGGVNSWAQNTTPAHELGSLPFRKIEILPNTYEYNDEFVIKLSYDRLSNLVVVEVVPKYYLQKSVPSWAEPDRLPGLDSSDFGKILDQIDKLRTVGNLEIEGKIGLTLNLNTTLRDVYEKAIVERRMGDTGFTKNSLKVFRSFSIYFSRQVSGNVEELSQIEIAPNYYLRRVRINDCYYWGLGSPRVNDERINEFFGPLN